MMVVALESTVFAHGLPSPTDVEVALELEETVLARGGVPKTIGIVDGRIVVGLSREEIRRLASETGISKVSQRDIPVMMAQGGSGATTVAATAWIACRNDIEVVCTGGLGGIHRGRPFDVSNDLHVLATTPVTVVCSGPKAILDLEATREFLESSGVTVVGFETSQFPAFYSASSGLSVDVRCDSVEEVAEIVRSRRAVGLKKATVVVVPVPAEFEIPAREIAPFIQQAEQEAAQEGVKAADLTPFLLDRIAHITEGRSLAANRALLMNNAAVAAELAKALAPGALQHPVH
jgi:pseudouridine-5'-phosphate glycosidase